MHIDSLIYRRANSVGRRTKAAWVVAAWLLIVLLLVLKHVFWRDEVRALSLSLQGDDVFGMLRGIQGEGHPAIWYLLLRGAHALASTPLVLPAVSVAVALAAASLLAFRSPFAFSLIVLFLMGRIGLYEYAVMARNYGISMLLMFAFAALYSSYRDRGIVLGGVLFLLTNTNVHSVMMAGALMLFWLIDIVMSSTRQNAAMLRKVLRNYLLNAVIVLAGVVVCVATVYPPFNDAAQVDLSGGLILGSLFQAVALPASSFGDLVYYGRWSALLDRLSLLNSTSTLVSQALFSVLLVGSTLGLIRRPAALTAALVALLGLSIFFTVIYPGGYRHQSLWVVLLMCLYWIAGRNEAHPAMPAVDALRTFGLAMFGLILVLQLVKAIPVSVAYAPESRSRDLAALVASHPELKDATVIADPDYLVESLPYYIPNRTYLIREGRYGNVTIFTRKARLMLTLDDILEQARSLHVATGQPVVILLNQRLDPSAPARVIKEGYNWQLSITPEQTQSFLSATRRIASFGPTCCSDESYDVHVLK